MSNCEARLDWYVNAYNDLLDDLERERARIQKYEKRVKELEDALYNVGVSRVQFYDELNAQPPIHLPVAETYRKTFCVDLDLLRGLPPDRLADLIVDFQKRVVHDVREAVMQGLMDRLGVLKPLPSDISAYLHDGDKRGV